MACQAEAEERASATRESADGVSQGNTQAARRGASGVASATGVSDGTRRSRSAESVTAAPSLECPDGRQERRATRPPFASNYTAVGSGEPAAIRWAGSPPPGRERLRSGG